MVFAPHPDILVTGDGKHIAVVGGDGRLALLRERSGDYVVDTLRENAGVKTEPVAIEDWPGARCTSDTCIVTIERGGRLWRILATRSRYFLPPGALIDACGQVEIVVSERWLPQNCKPKWIKADRNKLAETGGLAFYLAQGRVETVTSGTFRKPWFRRPPVFQKRNPRPQPSSALEKR
jgi:competence protein ComEC